MDATLIAAPSSTKHEKRARAPEMHQTKKGNQWYFGLKAYIGADRDSKLVHTVVVAATNVADITHTAALLHGAETQVHADAGYTGVEKRPEIVALPRRIDWQIAAKRSVIQALAEGAPKDAHKAVEKAKAAVRAFVAPLPHREESFPLSENALPRTGEKWAPTPHALRSGQRGDRRAPGRNVKWPPPPAWQRNAPGAPPARDEVPPPPATLERPSAPPSVSN